MALFSTPTLVGKGCSTAQQRPCTTQTLVLYFCTPVVQGRGGAHFSNTAHFLESATLPSCPGTSAPQKKRTGGCHS
eukprot:scaffold6059_cov22-Tisochrysis_lutea.AAC.7